MKSDTIPFHTNPSPNGIFIRRIEDADTPAGRDESHRDNYYIIAILTSGCAFGLLDFREVSIAANQAMIIIPSQVHTLRSYDKNTRGWLMALGQELFSAEEINLLSKCAIHSEPFSVDTQLITDISQLLKLCQQYTEIPSIVHHSVAMIKALLLKQLPALSGKRPNRYLNIMVEFKRLLEAHIAAEKAPSAYASMMNISEVYLNEAVKNATGLSASAYIRSQVILEAKRLLAYTHLTPSDIALSLGYDDYSYFSRLFKKETAQSPTELRRNLK